MIAGGGAHMRSLSFAILPAKLRRATVPVTKPSRQIRATRSSSSLPREEDRALDPLDDVARVPFSAARQSGDRRTAAGRLRRQTADGPSDRMVGSVVRARSQGARIGRIEP